MRAVVRDSAGIRIIDNPGPALATVLGWTLSKTPSLDIGGAEPDDVNLFEVNGAIRFADGRIVLANNGSQELVFFGKEGDVITRTGGTGGGPGEFSAISWIAATPDDSIVAWDARQDRLSVFTADGTYTRTFRLNPHEGAGRVRVRGMMEDGTLIVAASNIGDLPPSGVIRPDERVMRYDLDGEFTSDLGTFPSQAFYLQATREAVSIFPATFSRSTSYDAGNGHVYAGNNDHSEVHLMSMDGDLITIVRLELEPVQVTPMLLSAYQSRTAAGAPTAQARQQITEAFNQIPVPETLPAYGRILMDEEGFLWVEQYTPHPADPKKAMVFDAEGVALGSLELPGSFTVHQIGTDFILGLWRDDLDVEHVLMYDLNRVP
jgi:hypothetical protein